MATSILIDPAQARPGDLDPTFGVGGKVLTDIGGRSEQASGVAIQADGKIVVALVGVGDFAVSRYNSDGTLDGSFGVGGVVSADMGDPFDEAFDLALQADGKIVVAGGAGFGEFALARFNSDGTLDATFDEDGRVITNFGGGDSARAVSIQADGKIMAVGITQNPVLQIDSFALARYNPDGSLDPTFGVDGKVTTDFGGSDTAWAIVLQPDGKIVVVGKGGSGLDFALARYNPDGSLDPEFGDAGKILTDFGSNDGARHVVLQPDGKIIAAGTGANRNALARYNRDGSLDTSFDGDGMTTLEFFGENIENAHAVALQDDGKIVTAGVARGGFDNSFAVARFNVDGSTDLCFGINGKVTTDFGDPADVGVLCPPSRKDCSSDIAWDLALQADGAIVVVGGAGAGTPPPVHALARYLGDAPVNPPVVSSLTRAIDEDEVVVFAEADFDRGFHHCNDAGAPLEVLRIVSLPTTGALVHSGGGVIDSAPLDIARDQIAGMQYVPLANFEGPTAAFEWNASDGHEFADNPATYTFDITPIPVEQFGLFYYVVVGDSVEITDYPDSETGLVDIPAEIDGKPVTSIGYMAFAHCSGLTSVTIPDSVTSIADGAFAYCSALESMVLPDSVTTMGNWVFSHCSRLTSVNLSSGLNSLGGETFLQCTRLASVTVPAGTESIGEGAFQGCWALTDVTIPGGLVVIEDRAFLECQSLTTVTIPGTVASIGGWAFAGCPALTDVTVGDGVTTIGAYTFAACDSLETIVIPDSVIRMGEAAFGACDRLRSVALSGNLLTIEDSLFLDCPSLGSVNIPGSVTSIGRAAFSNCRNLASVTIPDGVRSIGDYAFAECDRLSVITIPGSVSDLGTGAFFSCGGLSRVNLAEGLARIKEDTFMQCLALQSVTIPEGVTHIEAGAFGLCSGLLELDLPASITMIGAGAFGGCRGLGTARLPEDLAVIGDYAFNNCAGLREILFPAGIVSLGKGAFRWCGNLATAVFLGDAPTLGADAFRNTRLEFTIYFLSSRSGFSSPSWEGYAATEIDETGYPAASWLLWHGLWYDSDLDQDRNGDGVNLLMAYALDLDPQLHLAGSLPISQIGPDTLAMKFYAASPGITYTVETSADLRIWVTEGVSLAPLDSDNCRTASVHRDSPARFLRLIVEQ